MTKDGETELENATRKVWKGKAQVERQRAIVQKLRESSHATAEAEALLGAFEKAQRAREKCLETLPRGLA